MIVYPLGAFKHKIIKISSVLTLKNTNIRNAMILCIMMVGIHFSKIPRFTTICRVGWTLYNDIFLAIKLTVDSYNWSVAATVPDNTMHDNLSIHNRHQFVIHGRLD